MKLDGDSIQFRCLSPEKSLHTFIDYLQESHELTSIVDIEQVALVEAMLTYLERNLPLNRTFQLILVSKASSWAKSVPSSGNIDLSQAFRRRAPTPSAQERYLIESRMKTLHQCNIRVKVVYIGQVYGGSGYDLQNVFKSIWDRELSIPASVVETYSKTVVGMIHVQRLKDLFLSLLQPLPTVNPDEEAGEEAGKDERESELSKSFIIPAFDCCEIPFLQLMSQCNAIINSGINNVANTENTTLSPSLLSTLLNSDTHVTAFIPALRNSAIFDQTSSLSLNWEQSWGEFLSSNTLRPARILIASPPGYTARSENAMSLASRLQLPYVDVLSAVLFSLRLLVMSTSSLPPNVHHAKVNDLKSLLLSTFEAKLAEGTKKKDKNAASGLVTDGRLDESLVTPALCATIPIDLQQKAIVLYSLLDINCVRKGMVLDCWDVEGLRDMEFFNTLANAFAADPIAPADAGEVVADAESVVRCPIDVVVELTCPDKFLLKELQESYGAGFAKNKEGQAAYKSLEASLTAYTTSLVQYTAQQTQAMTHPCIKNELDKYNHHDDETAEGEVLNCVLLQWDISASHEQLVDEIATEVLHSRSDCLGWVRTTSAATEVPTEADPESNATGESVADISQSEQEKRVDPSKVKGLEKYNEFLTNTLLPVLAKGMIQAIRGDAYDPIKFLAEFMLQESAQRQQAAYEQAKVKFEDMVANN